MGHLTSGRLRRRGNGALQSSSDTRAGRPATHAVRGDRSGRSATDEEIPRVSLLKRIRRAVRRRIPRQYAIRWRLLRERHTAVARQADREAEFFLVSYPKCGRTWLRVLLSRALETHYGAPEVDYLGGAFLGGNVPGAPRVRVTHDDDPHWKTPRGLDRRKRRYRGKRVVLLVRDPRDVVVSMYFERSRRERAYDGTLSAFLHERRGSLDTILAYYNVWAASRGIPSELLIVRYEDLRRETERELRRLLEFLGVKGVAAETVGDAVRFASFESMREMESAGSLGSGRLRPRDPNDPESFKTRRGKVGGFVDYLTPEEIADVERRIRTGLDPGFGYAEPRGASPPGGSEALRSPVETPGAA